MLLLGIEQKDVASMNKTLMPVNTSKIESYLFALIVIFNLLPIFFTHFVPTIDGVAHIYNSKLVLKLLTDSGTEFNNLFLLNSNIVPNWIGHAYFVIFTFFLPAFVAEKVFFLTYLIGMPYVFRIFLIKTAGNKMVSYLIFPFCYSSMFLFGFFNFSIAVILLIMLFTICFKKNAEIFRKKVFAKISILLILLFFSHAFVLILFYLVLMVSILFQFIVFRDKKKRFYETIKSLFLKVLYFTLASIIPLFLLIRFKLFSINTSDLSYFGFDKLWRELTHFSSLIAFVSEVEKVYTQAIVLLLLFLVITISLSRILASNEKDNKQEGKFNFFERHDYWLLVVIILVVLYFLLPNSIGSASLISRRISYFIFFSLLIWIAFSPIKKWALSIVITVLLFCNFSLNSFYSTIWHNLNELAVNINNASDYIKPGSVVVSFNNTENWVTKHFSNYLAVDKDLILLENYEIKENYFPLVIDSNKFPQYIIGSKNQKELGYGSWLSNDKNQRRIIDYVLIFGINNKSESNQKLERELANYYGLIYNNKEIKLYKKK